MIKYIATDTLNTRTENRNFEIYNYGTDNLYPNYSQIIGENSAALGRCLKTYRAFLFGGGMTTDSGFWKKTINIYGLRIDQFLRTLIEQFSIHNGFSFKVIYNLALEPVGFVPVPFENCRLAYADDNGLINKIKYYKDWSAARIEKNAIKEFDVFTNDKDSIAKQIENAGGIEKWNGQIFYYGKNGEVKYPHAYFHDVLEDCLTDIALKKGKNSNAHTNFMGSHIFQLPFTFEDLVATINETNPDVSASAETLRNEYVANLEKFQGAENQGKIMMIENPFKDNDGKMIPFALNKVDVQNLDKLYEGTEITIKENIRGCYQIPPILLDPVAVGFSTEIMQSFYNYYNIVTQQYRQIFEEVFMTIFSNFNGKNATADYSIKPLQYMGDEETGGILAVQLGVGGTTAMQSILVDPILTVDQKIGILQVLFGLDEATSKLMLGLN
jgi:hypothetical protein